MSGMNNAKNDDGMGRMRVPSVNAAQRHGLAPKDRAMVGIQSSGVMPASQSMPIATHIAPFLVEFIGTFFLVHVISLLRSPAGAIGVGAILMCMVYMGGHISGGVYNPAVTLALVLRGEFSVFRGLGYIFVQVAAGIAAALAGFAIVKTPGVSPGACPGPGSGFTEWDALLAEFLYTLALCYVVLSVATCRANHGNSFYGLSIGFTVLSGAILVAPISGAVFNPAVGTGITVASLVYNPDQSCPVWIYWAAPMAAGIVAAGLYRLTDYDSFIEDDQLPSNGDEPPPSKMRFVAKPLMEAIGTFYLVLAISLSTRASFFAPLAIGSTLMVMVYSGGHISGALYNPAVTLGVALRGGGLLSWAGMFVYFVVQVGAATGAAAVGHWLSGDTVHPFPMGEYTIGQAFGAEALFTFALVSVVLNVATSNDCDGGQFFGISIGFTVLAGATAVGEISGAAFNPAVATGLSLIAAAAGVHGALDHLWLYWAAPLAGAIVAAAVFWVTSSKERFEEEHDSGASSRAPSSQQEVPLLASPHDALGGSGGFGTVGHGPGGAGTFGNAGGPALYTSYTMTDGEF